MCSTDEREEAPAKANDSVGGPIKAADSPEALAVAVVQLEQKQQMLEQENQEEKIQEGDQEYIFQQKLPWVLVQQVLQTQEWRQEPGEKKRKKGNQLIMKSKLPKHEG